ncbi:hypothetical protein MMC14_004461 [Varicellaria rhodocarpa]|nr:hypothetical protein [Varicellaria rhodocarpa]
MSPSSPLLAVIAGVGPGTGAAVARKFAQSYSVVLLARSPKNFEPLVEEINKAGGHAIGISADVADEESMKSAFEKIKGEGKGLAVSVVWKELVNRDGVENVQSVVEGAAAVYNVGSGFVRKPFLELQVSDWDNGYSGTLSSSEPPKYPPTLIFTGATASIKGSAMCSSFAQGKWAARALAQSLGREFGPKGVHVGHAIIDGVIDIERTKSWQFEHDDAKISADAIADAYWHLHTQPRTSFTWEIDMRPYVEKW